MLFLYSIPAQAISAVIVFAMLPIALDGCMLFHRAFPVTFDAERHSMTIAMMITVIAINSLLVAFSVISVWGTYQTTADIVVVKAVCATEPVRDLSAFSHPGTTAARNELVTYLQHVMRDEWPSMQQYVYPDVNTEAAFDIMSATANHITLCDDRECVLLVEMPTYVDEIVKHREKRLQSLETTIPGTPWGVMPIASSLSLLPLYTLPATRFYMALVAVWTTVLGLTFLFALVVDRPFAGEAGVSAAPLERATQTLSNDKPQVHPELD